MCLLSDIDRRSFTLDLEPMRELPSPPGTPTSGQRVVEVTAVHWMKQDINQGCLIVSYLYHGVVYEYPSGSSTSMIADPTTYP